MSELETGWKLLAPHSPEATRLKPKTTSGYIIAVHAHSRTFSSRFGGRSRIVKTVFCNYQENTRPPAFFFTGHHHLLDNATLPECDVNSRRCPKRYLSRPFCLRGGGGVAAALFAHRSVNLFGDSSERRSELSVKSVLSVSVASLSCIISIPAARPTAAERG